MIRIRFGSRADESRGFYLLFTHGTARSLADGVYEIAESLLEVLSANGVPCERLKDVEAGNEAHAFRDPLAAGLQ